MIANQHRSRFVLIALAGISLLMALWAGTLRLGWPLPAPGESFVVNHGPLMIIGFLGVLIGLERAVALGRSWPYGVPALSGAAALLVLTEIPVLFPAMTAIVSSLLLVGVFISLHRQYPSEHFIVMGMSAFVWMVGNIVWLMGSPLFAVAPWWIGFLVLMIAGERLELSRLRRPSATVRGAFYASASIIMIGLGVSLADFHSGIRLSGVGLLAVALWLLRYDLVWHTVRQAGLPRYMAVCLIAGYVWLATGGIFWTLFAPFFSAGPRYDAMLHSILVGFVFSMIFAHAPIILPSVTGFAMPFQQLFYGHLVLLHISLLLRVGGDLAGSRAAQQWGGLINVLAILLFLANNALAVKRGEGRG